MPVVKFSRSREHKIARELAQYRRELEEQERRLSELAGYRDDTMQRLRSQGDNGLGVAKMKDYRLFLAKLDGALSLQRQKVDTMLVEYEEKKRRWLASRSRHKALRKVLSNHQRQELRAAENQEQKDTDERSQRPRNRNGDTDT